LIDFGGATDADCRALMEDARENVEARTLKQPSNTPRAGANSAPRGASSARVSD
jgi:hypothetical protein